MAATGLVNLALHLRVQLPGVRFESSAYMQIRVRANGLNCHDSAVTSLQIRALCQHPL
jgi:hypothetical protein